MIAKGSNLSLGKVRELGRVHSLLGALRQNTNK